MPFQKKFTERNQTGPRFYCYHIDVPTLSLFPSKLCGLVPEVPVQVAACAVDYTPSHCGMTHGMCILPLW